MWWRLDVGARAPGEAAAMEKTYPVSFAVDYPDRPLDRLTSAFRIFTVIPIAVVLAAIGGYSNITATAPRPPRSRSAAPASSSCRRC
jgi:hypothetical protein